MKDGLYILPSDNGIMSVKIKDGIPADVCTADGPASSSIPKLNAARPDWNFDEAETLSKPVPGAKDRVDFMKSLVKLWLSLPKDKFKNQVGMFIDAWTESANAFESAFTLTVLVSPSAYISAGHSEFVSEEAKARDKRADLAKAIIFLPAFDKFKSIYKKDAAGAELRTRWLNDPESIECWEWTKKDAEEAASVMKANPAYA